jgi:hypothetical protein
MICLTRIDCRRYLWFSVLKGETRAFTPEQTCQAAVLHLDIEQLHGDSGNKGAIPMAPRKHGASWAHFGMVQQVTWPDAKWQNRSDVCFELL